MFLAVVFSTGANDLQQMVDEAADDLPSVPLIPTFGLRHPVAAEHGQHQGSASKELTSRYSIDGKFHGRSRKNANDILISLIPVQRVI
jgi:hypothetical protein